MLPLLAGSFLGIGSATHIFRNRWKRPGRKNSRNKLLGEGFGSVRAVPLTFGIVYLFVAVKDGASGPGVIIE